MASVWELTALRSGIPLSRAPRDRSTDPTIRYICSITSFFSLYVKESRCLFFFFHTLVKWNELIFLQWVGLGVFFDTFDNNGRVLYLWILISSVYIYLSLSFVSLYPPAFLAGGLTCTCVALLTAQGYLNTISAVMNDGTKTYDHASDGETMALGVCRCAPLLHLYSAARDDGDGDGGWTGG